MKKSRYIEMRPRKTGKKKTAQDVGDLLARELKRVESCEKEVTQAKRRLARARMRYSVLKRLATSPLFALDEGGGQ